MSEPFFVLDFVIVRIFQHPLTWDEFQKVIWLSYQAIRHLTFFMGPESKCFRIDTKMPFEIVSPIVHIVCYTCIC
jgi:hypothetical protein